MPSATRPHFSRARARRREREQRRGAPERTPISIPKKFASSPARGSLVVDPVDEPMFCSAYCAFSTMRSPSGRPSATAYASSARML
jgi:hypothetical protein